MARKTFLSFHYKPDNWRVSQIKQIGAIEEQTILTSNEWEQVEKGGDKAIKDWIDGQLKGKNCQVVLIGAKTAGRKWVKYEIEQSWNANKGVLGVHIHNMLDKDGKKTAKGSDPFSTFTVNNGESMTKYAKAYDPPVTDSKEVYKYISDNIETWIEDAIKLRGSA